MWEPFDVTALLAAFTSKATGVGRTLTATADLPEGPLTIKIGKTEWGRAKDKAALIQRRVFDARQRAKYG